MTHSICIIGAGPAGLMAAERLSAVGFFVSVYDQKPSPARKLLMAGRGGLNITHSEDFEQFVARYGAAANLLRSSLEYFTPHNVREWCAGLGEETFIGTSGRVFPKSFKASPLLRAWLARLTAQRVNFHMNHLWAGWSNDGALDFESPQGTKHIAPDMTIFALGGASWPRLGSDGGWARLLENRGISVVPFSPSNCGFITKWSDVFRDKFAGTPLKAIGVTHDGHRLQGDVMITQNGIEGGVIYALSASLRDAIAQGGSTTITLDLKTDVDEEQLIKMLSRARGRYSFTNFLRKVTGLPPVSIGLLLEDRAISKLSTAEVARRIKRYPLLLTASCGIERAISSAGGIARDEVDDHFMLKKIPNTYVLGEMLDWEAPTGGYLLQASLSMAAWCAQGIIKG